MATHMRKVFSALLGKTCHFSHRRPSSALITLSTNCIHTSCGNANNFENDQSHYKEIVDNNSGNCVHDVEEEKDVSFSNLSLTEEELKQYPTRRFPGNIYVIKKPSNEQELEILDVLNKLRREEVLGFDAEMTEWIDHYHMKRSKRTRVVQIASQTDAVVWQLKKFKGLPLSLVSFLKSDNILKVGHAISDDVVLLKKEFNIKSRCLFDTLPWAMELDCKPLGLHGLCAIFLGWRISKGLRTSDWNRDELSENQIYYACTDAWASLMLYNKMKRVALENGSKCPSSISSVNDILNTRLISKRKRRSRLVKNNIARKNYNLLVETASKVVE